MILKVYIKKHLFHLPRKQDDLTSLVKEKLYKRKKLIKSGITKLYRISEIESNNIKFDKNVNIFLVNLYLLTIDNEKNPTTHDDVEITLSDENILTALSNIIGEKLIDLSIEEVEFKINNYLNGVETKGSDTDKDNDIKVEFNLDWVKAMDRRIRE